MPTMTNSICSLSHLAPRIAHSPILSRGYSVLDSGAVSWLSSGPNSMMGFAPFALSLIRPKVLLMVFLSLSAAPRIA